MVQTPEFFDQLRALEDAQRRGYIFEQYIRETLPWSFRPPIALRTESEQIDGFFEFNGWHFLIEAKAKQTNITPGSPDWEDFELKIRRRGGQCIGLFCSLWPVSAALHDAASSLNKNSFTTIVISGNQWDEICTSPLQYSDFIRYLVSEARSKYTTNVENINIIYDKLVSRIDAERKIRDLLSAASTTFLRRNRSPRHEDLYVTRNVDAQLHDLILQLQPSRLQFEKKRSRDQNVSASDRAPPTQFAIIRDFSGAGKTTLATQLFVNAAHLCVVKAAIESDIDAISEVLERVGRAHGLFDIIAANKPVVYVLDSLDEALIANQKRAEFKGLFNSMSYLNTEAERLGLLCFPIIIVCTVRDEYWRDWESLFDGRRSHLIVRRYSKFSSGERSAAIAKYQNVYNYSISGTVNDDLLDALAHPFTLQIYSEANEDCGSVDATEHFGSHVLALFFERKKENIIKRPIVGFDGDAMVRLCALFAVRMVEKASNEINIVEASNIVKEYDPLLIPRFDSIMRSLRSEQIFMTGEADDMPIRFRHGRFLEYLLALKILQDLRANEIVSSIIAEERELEELMQEMNRRRSLLSRFLSWNIADRTSSRNHFADTARRRIVNERVKLGRTIGRIYEMIDTTTFASPFVVFDFLKSISAKDEKNR